MHGVYMRAEERNAGGLYKADSNDKCQLYAVCDGMGGMDRGEAASLMAVSNIVGLSPLGTRRFTDGLRSYIDKTSDKLLYSGKGSGSAGCTLAAVYLDGSGAMTANLGDSRVYLKRKALPLALVTEDHSQAVWYMKQGVLTAEEAETHPSRNTLRRYIGAPDAEGRTPDVAGPARIKRGDTFLICSDGLSNMLNATEIDAEISTEKSCADICRQIVTLALGRGGDDNITAMLIRVS